MENKNKQFEYVIGIDLGHGETSAAICPLQWDTPVELLESATDLDMGGNKKVMPSAITILDDGRAYIGDSAFNPEVLKQAKVRVCFKQAPKDMNGEAEKLMMRFMHEVYKRIRENNSAVLTDTNHLVYIATPSGWDMATQQLYVQMARTAGLPMGGVTKESRAAFVRAQHDTTSGLGQNIEKGSIVFDMGSSTLDFTYMNKNLSEMIDYGYDCGASHVEKTIFLEQEVKSDAIKLFEQKYPRLIDYLVFEARKVKEEVYFDPTLKKKKTINFDDFIDDEDLEDERFKLMFNPGELNELLRTSGYLQMIENAMNDYKRNHIPNQEIYGVFLTGGASRMDFLKPMICKCWGVTEKQIYRDQDPSLTISQGVAEVARMDMRTAGMDKGLEEEINQLQHSDTIYNLFLENFVGDLNNAIVEAVANAFVGFKDSTENLSLNDLSQHIINMLEEIKGVASNEISNYINQAISEKTEIIRAKVENIIQHYSAQGANIELNAISVPSVSISNINLDAINEVLKSVLPTSSGWGGAAWGAGIGWVLLGPIGGAIGGWLGKSLSSTSPEENLAKSLDQETRIKVYNSVFEGWDTLKEKIETSIQSSIASDLQIKQQIRNSAYNYLQIYKENLKSARILID